MSHTCGVPFGQLLHLIQVYDLFMDDTSQIACLQLYEPEFEAERALFAKSQFSSAKPAECNPSYP